MAWIKLHDRITEWQWFGKPEMVQMMVYFLIKAARRRTVYRGTVLERGQLITSRNRLHGALGLSDKRIRICLNRLQESGDISVKSTNKFSIITICKYDSYQGSARAKGPTRDQVTDPETDQEEDLIIAKDKEGPNYYISKCYNVEETSAGHKRTNRRTDKEASTGASLYNNKNNKNIKKGINNNNNKEEEIPSTEIVVAVDEATQREKLIENLKQEFYSSPMKMEQLRRSARIDGSTLLYELCEQVWAEWAATEVPLEGINWRHLANHVRIKAEARRREDARLAAIPKPKPTVKEWRQKLAHDVLADIAAHQAMPDVPAYDPQNSPFIDNYYDL